MIFMLICFGKYGLAINIENPEQFSGSITQTCYENHVLKASTPVLLINVIYLRMNNRV